MIPPISPLSPCDRGLIPGLCLLALALLVAAPLAIPAPPNPTALAEIPAAMKAEIAAHRAAGTVTLVAHEGTIVHHDAAGAANREKNLPMAKDTVFWIASMTKSISVTAILTLADEGRLSLDEPASNYLPELKEVTLEDGGAPSRPITLRDLMSHTSGLAFPPRRASDGAQSLKSYTAELVSAPLAFEPGSAYQYGFGITVAGRIAEIVSGQPFEVFLQERILDPLGMKDTSFHPDERLRARMAQTYKTAEEGQGLALAYNTFVTPDPSIRRMTEPSGGLFSTAEDMNRFYQMILNEGLHGGVRIVSKAAIAEMTRPHSAGGKPIGYGLGWQCGTPEKPGIPGFSSRAFGHGGAFGTHGWVDPERRLVTVFLVQNVLVKDGGKVRDAFLGKVAAAAATVTEAPKPQYDDGRIVVPAAHAGEPLRGVFSAEAADQHLRDGSLAWSESKSCISCHTNGAYLTLRPALTPWLGKPDATARDFFLAELTKLKGLDPASLQKGTRPAQAIYLAAGLAEWDRHVAGSLSPETGEALEFMFSLQVDAGAWASLDCWPPLESDAFHLATVAAMAAGTAPGWLDGEKPAASATGLEKLRGYLVASQPPHDYSRVLLLWASTRLPGLLDDTGRAAVVARLRELQRPDGGWSIRAFAAPEAWGAGNRAEKLRAEPEFTTLPSDGHQTGLAVVALRDAGIPVADPAIQKGLAWIKSQQRESGRWWTRSLNTDKAHYITYSGTALSLLALGKCGELEQPAVAAAR